MVPRWFMYTDHPFSKDKNCLKKLAHSRNVKIIQISLIILKEVKRCEGPTSPNYESINLKMPPKVHMHKNATKSPLYQLPAPLCLTDFTRLSELRGEPLWFTLTSWMVLIFLCFIVSGTNSIYLPGLPGGLNN